MDPKRITLIVTGSIAAVKTVELMRLLEAKGAAVSLVFTPAALQWIDVQTRDGGTSISLTEEAQQWSRWKESSFITHAPVLSAADMAANPERITALFNHTNAIVVAPASADFMKQLAYEDTPLSRAIRQSGKPLYVAPAMNVMMWQHPATQRNARQLAGDGVRFLGPIKGNMACGDQGYGRFMEPAQISEAITSTTNPIGLSAFEDALTPHPAPPILDKETAQKPCKKILLLIQGGQDALGSVALVTRLRSQGYEVMCAASEEAARLLPLDPLAAVSGHEVYTHHYQDVQEKVKGMEHIRLPERADIVLVAPASAQGVKEMAQGGAQSFTGCIYLASKKPVIIVPSADPSESIAASDVERLKNDGAMILNIPKQLPIASTARAEAVVAALDQLIQQKATGHEHAIG